MTQPSTIKHHLSEDLLAGYAAGKLSEATDLLIAAHISMCDECRARTESFEAIGGAVLDGDHTEVLSDDALAATLALIDAGPAQTKPQSPEKGDLPTPIRNYIGGDLDDIRWSSIGMGVKQSKLIKSKDTTARLLFIPAGVAVPEHGHHGQELTLVLKGAFKDEVDHFGRGDVEIADEHLEHTPIADEGADCICLAVTDASLRFKALLPRLIQPFIGF